MTSSQLDHLRRIDAHLANLLSTAEKRTPGEWTVGWNMIGDGISKSICNAPMRNEQTTTLERVSDKRFIASCAGNAEAVAGAATCSRLDVRQQHLIKVVGVWLSRAYQRTPETRARTAILKATQALYDLKADLEDGANDSTVPPLGRRQATKPE